MDLDCIMTNLCMSPKYAIGFFPSLIVPTKRSSAKIGLFRDGLTDGFWAILPIPNVRGHLLAPDIYIYIYYIRLLTNMFFDNLGYLGPMRHPSDI